MNNPKTIRMTVLATAIAAACSWASAQDVTLFENHALPEALVFEPRDTLGMETKVDMVVTGPADFYLRKSFEAGEPIELNPQAMVEGGMPDGTYQYELKVMGISGVTNDRDSGKPAFTESLQGGSGAFSIQNGLIVSQDLGEAPYKGPDAGISIQAKATQAATAAEEDATRDQVINDDLIVNGSLCVGLDCINGENFGFDTIRMKENNTRIKFDDTSNSGSFPNNDWQLTANDSANGGLNKFSIENTTAARIPFTIVGSAPTNSLYVRDNGNIGMGTSTPALQAHIADGNTPGLRLEQDGSSGFTPQIWDVAGNEANFFVRDVTNASALSFRIFPGAANDDALVIRNGNVGVGTDNPSTSLHVKESGGARLLVEDNSGTAGQRTLMQLINNGKTSFVMTNSSANAAWSFDNSGVSFDISRAGTGVAEFRLFDDGDAVFVGDVTANGVLLNSSRTLKKNIEPVDSDQLLDKVMKLPIKSWKYTADREEREHIGPIAEEFYALFEMGDGKRVDLIDTTGITIAALQAVANRQELQVSALNAQLDDYRRKLEHQRQAHSDRILALEAELERLQLRLVNTDIE